MNRFTAAVAIVLFVSLGRTEDLDAAERPHILYINADDLGVMDVGYKSSRYNTPNIDRLCREGMQFTESYAPAANCAPSRACVMSGQYSPRHGIYTVNRSDRGASHTRKIIPTPNTTELNPNKVTIADGLRDAGYRTIHLGKWHLSKDPCQSGFDLNIGGGPSGGPKGGYFSPFTQGSMVSLNAKYPPGTHRADILADETIRFLRENQGQPCFVNLAYFLVHSRLEAVPELVDKYKGKGGNAVYASMIEKLDQSIGKVLAGLETLGIRDNTLVVFTSDNGGVCSTSPQTPYRSGKGSYFDGGVRVPLVVRWPGKIKPGTSCSIPVMGTDFFPTFLDAANVPVPEGKQLDGTSLVPLLKQSGSIAERTLFWHFPIYLQGHQGGKYDSHDPLFRTRPGTALRQGKWKLHEYFEDGRLELYDLENDVAERKNVAISHPQKTRELHKLMKRWRTEVEAPVPTQPNPEYRSNSYPTDSKTDPRSPVNAVSGIETTAGLQATLVGSEPELRSLTNLDIDSRGRVWVCDVMNYRRNRDSRPEGDRILILEDTNGDGVMDEVKTFYQGRDIDSAMGLCVLENENGCEVIVTASPNVWRFTDRDGDDVPDSQVAMFTETGQPQHDHSAHSFLFGPDGKLYWNMGNTGRQVKDANGNVVVDIHGRPVIDNGKPLHGGMPFRCDLDGSHFEVLAHNFRNSWETTVDSFGSLWQSDNDDDGHRSTRINFVMEHGNYGYLDERTAAGWQAERINMEQETRDRHWHVNDPGVAPNLLSTGAGSPSGICVYEGRLLPKRFWDQVIHCDPGPNAVRAYPTKPAGAGYSATTEPLVTGKTDPWFRPVDVCVAPDGSLFVTDWYDPGVGGHRQEDINRGRLFRIAPANTRYTIPKFDFSTIKGACEALKNPCLSVRYRAWQTLRFRGAAAEPELQKLYQDPNPRVRARALWLLGKIDGRGRHYVNTALEDPNADLRIVGIRLAKQLTEAPASWIASVASDASPAVRREAAIAIRYDSSHYMPKLWAKLASRHDGADRWYLEALGIGSDIRPEECFDAYLAQVDGQWDTPTGWDIVWRVRSAKAAEAMVTLISNPTLPIEKTDRYFRSLELHDAEVRSRVLQRLLP